MSDLYGEDILLWSKHQTGLLRRMAAGEQVNDQVDWEHVIEEIAEAGEEGRDLSSGIPTDALAGLHDAVAAAQDALSDVSARLEALTAARWQRGSDRQIRLSFAAELLERIDKIAHRKHLSRLALLTEWINERLQQEGQ